MLGIYTSAAFTNQSGLGVAAAASIEVKDEDTGNLSSIFSDVDGLVVLANPFSADANGRFEFYAGGREQGYRVKVTKDAVSHTLRYQAIGTAQQFDWGEFTRGLFKNRIINGLHDIWQRNTSFTTPASTAVTADRWRVTYDGTIGTFTVSRQAFTLGQTAVPGEPKYHLRWDHTAAGSGSTIRRLSQKIEGVRALAGVPACISFYAKADAARTVGTHLMQRMGTGGSPSADVDSAIANHSLTTAWQKFKQKLTPASLTGKTLGSNNNDNLELIFDLPLNTTMTIDIARVQLEAGSLDTEFERRSERTELELAQRFYEKSFQLATAPVTNVGANTGETNFIAGKAGATAQMGYAVFKTRKWATPTITLYNPQAANAQVRDQTGAVDCSASAAANATEVGFRVDATGNAATAVGNRLAVHWQADAESLA